MIITDDMYNNAEFEPIKACEKDISNLDHELNGYKIAEINPIYCGAETIDGIQLILTDADGKTIKALNVGYGAEIEKDIKLYCNIGTLTQMGVKQ